MHTATSSTIEKPVSELEIGDQMMVGGMLLDIVRVEPSQDSYFAREIMCANYQPGYKLQYPNDRMLLHITLTMSNNWIVDVISK